MSSAVDQSYPQEYRVRPVHVEDSTPVNVNSHATHGVVAPAGSNGAATAAATDYPFSWAASVMVNHIMLQNNTAGAVNYDFDTAANPGSPMLAAGQTIFLDATVQVLHLYTAGAQPVNGNTGNNIVVRGWI